MALHIREVVVLHRGVVVILKGQMCAGHSVLALRMCWRLFEPRRILAIDDVAELWRTRAQQSYR